MLLLGAGVLLTSLKVSPWAWIAACVYVVYGVVGALWIILFVCPYCASYGRRSCPCGYGVLAAKLRKQGDPSLFATQFKRHIPFIVPLWFIPMLVGIPMVILSFSWFLMGLLVVFALNSFVLLPRMSTGVGCKECPQREVCPWMGPGSTQEERKT